jgi:hypothetical protein
MAPRLQAITGVVEFESFNAFGRVDRLGYLGRLEDQVTLTVCDGTSPSRATGPVGRRGLSPGD